MGQGMYTGSSLRGEGKEVLDTGAIRVNALRPPTVLVRWAFVIERSILIDMLHALKQVVKRGIASVEFSRPVWRWLNRGPRALFAENPSHPTPLQTRLIQEMKRDGITVTHMDELFADRPELFAGMIANLETRVSQAQQDPKKTHFKNLWNSRFFALDPKDEYVQFALSPEVLTVANGYMEMWTRLLLCNAYQTNLKEPGEARVQTQNWHRDAHDRQLAVAFLYLTDVETDEDGPFWYIKGSHVYGSLKSFYPQPAPYSGRGLNVPDEAVATQIPEDKKMMCLGKKGTIVFADGTGIHRGGYCTRNARVLALAAYSSEHRFAKSSRVSYPPDTGDLRAMLTPEGVYAARLERGTPVDMNTGTLEADSY